MIENVVFSVGAALVYSFTFYAKKYDLEEKEEFNKWKFISTLTVGLAVGVGSIVVGYEVTYANIETKLIAYTGLIALIESFLKMAYRRYRKMKKQRRS
jgi:putative Mn2+ efflux pump MntP